MSASAKFPWTCPFCDRNATITNENHRLQFNEFFHGNKHGTQFVGIFVVVCPNPNCGEYSLTVMLHDAKLTAQGVYSPSDTKQTWHLIPPATMKVFPDYVPEPIRADYREACLIRDLSPKASATLARRSLQGMIRNFWGVSKKDLFQEIVAIEDKVDPLTWKAIDAVRKVGNIGAHMEKDINLIIDVEPSEAAALIGLIEILIKDWYVAKHEREQRLEEIVVIANDKEAAKKAPTDPNKAEDSQSKSDSTNSQDDN